MVCSGENGAKEGSLQNLLRQGDRILVSVEVTGNDTPMEMAKFDIDPRDKVDVFFSIQRGDDGEDVIDGFSFQLVKPKDPEDSEVAVKDDDVKGSKKAYTLDEFEEFLRLERDYCRQHSEASPACPEKTLTAQDYWDDPDVRFEDLPLLEMTKVWIDKVDDLVYEYGFEGL